MPDKDKLIEFEWVLPETSVDEELESVTQEGGTVMSSVKPYEPEDPDDIDDVDSQFDPLLIVSISVAAGYLIKKISDVWLDHKRPGGQIVAGRDGKLVVRTAPHLERGALVVISDKATEFFNPSQKDEGLAFLTKFMGAYYA